MGGLPEASPLTSPWILTPPLISCQPSAGLFEDQVFDCQWVGWLATSALRDLGLVMKHSRLLCADGSGQTQSMYL